MTKPHATEHYFGFEKVADAAEKTGRVRDVFLRVANKYDLMNDLMSGGLHRAWKDVLVTSVNPPRSDQSFAVLDLAGGTGDIAFRLAAAGGAGTRVTVLDINPDMLAVGRTRALDRHDDAISFVEGNAESLPFPDRKFDAVTIAFGIRNVDETAAACAEMRRVLKPGGRLAILEFAVPTTPGVSGVYLFYLRHVLPRIGRVISRHHAAYGYLPASIGAFSTPDEFVKILRQAGFTTISAERLTFGSVILYTAVST